MATKVKRPVAAPAIRAPGDFPLWAYFLCFSAALFALFEVYGPAVRGPFVFDDLYLPYGTPAAAVTPLRFWLGVRPVLGLTFWSDFHLWGPDTFPYHVVNLLLHFSSAVLLFFIFRKLLALASTAEPVRTILSAFGAMLFLFHPVQTEVAAYIASRSEALSVFFFLAAFWAFLYRKTAAIDWQGTALVLLLFLLAIGSKEHTVTLPAILLLTDYFWNPGFSFTGIRANARLYIPLVLIGFVGAAFVYRYVAFDAMIGFHVEGLTPLTYFFTECRMIFRYLLLFFFPHSQNLDYDIALSNTPVEHGALLAFGCLLLLSTAAFLFRKIYPFAAFGFLSFLILLSPTSSFIPINDVLVERRLYLPFFALVLILFEPLRRIRARPFQLAAVLGGICCVAAYATWDRAQVWGSSLTLFEDAASKAPGKARVRIGYANALFHQGRCREAIREYDAASRMKTTDYILYFNMAAAYDCAKDPDNAIAMANRSIALLPKANTYTLLGKVLSEQSKFEESLGALNYALELDDSYTPALALRGVVYFGLGKPQQAYHDLQEALRRDPNNLIAQQGMAQLTQRR